MDVQIRVSEGDVLEELSSLWHWLLDVEPLRGYVSPVEQPTGETELGSALDLLTVVLTSGGTAMSLARALSTWLSTRRPDVKITVSTPNTQIEVDARKVKEVQEVTDVLLSALEQTLRGADGIQTD